MRIEIDNQLISEAARGDLEACGEIYRLLKDPIYGFAYRMTSNRAVAEEITQDVFVFFVQNAQRFDPGKGKLFTFLCGVARNKILNHLNRSGTRMETGGFEPDGRDNLNGGSNETPLKNLLAKEFSAVLLDGIESLSPLQREALLLREMEDMSYQEICEITESDLAVVKGRIHRARRALARSVAPYLEETQAKAYGLHKS